MSRSQLATHVSAVAKRDYKNFTATPLTGSFAAEISGIQIADAIADDELFTELRQAWLDYQVLFFRDQELSPEQH
ncbi:MAG: TauD/TfdA family dioxygenase, partial [Gammaproteobacteria bacterium]|nr:TauD/TfdA family dioxygenase [Gammaproteobacteria bacterium]